MEGFTYNDIFETKGIEYIAILVFFALLIPFWLILNRKMKAGRKIHNAVGLLSMAVLKIPAGVFHSKNHCWTFLDKKGIASLGVDDLLIHFAGDVKFSNQKKPGDKVMKGEWIATLTQGSKELKLFTPISGDILTVNSKLTDFPELLNEEPYGNGWMFRIKPDNWVAETSNYYLAEEAVEWTSNELARMKGFIVQASEPYSADKSMIVMQDGGEISDRPLSGFPQEIWTDFQLEFLSKF
jgi:glycine cleavage system H protein